MSTPDAELLRRARELADDELFPRAIDVDHSGEIPTAQLDLLAEAGMYGVSVRSAPATVTTLIETIASGCLTTAFVWQQHAGAAMAAARTDGPMHAAAVPMTAGDLRGGVAFAHLLRPGTPVMQAVPDGDGWRFTGRAPWVTGWGHIDLVYAAARFEDQIVWCLLDAHESDTLASERLQIPTFAPFFTRACAAENPNPVVPPTMT